MVATKKTREIVEDEDLEQLDNEELASPAGDRLADYDEFAGDSDADERRRDPLRH